MSDLRFQKLTPTSNVDLMGGLDFMMLHGSHTFEEIVSEKVVDPMDALIFRRTKRQNFIIG